MQLGSRSNLLALWARMHLVVSASRFALSRLSGKAWNFAMSRRKGGLGPSSLMFGILVVIWTSPGRTRARRHKHPRQHAHTHTPTHRTDNTRRILRPKSIVTYFWGGEREPQIVAGSRGGGRDQLHVSVADVIKSFETVDRSILDCALGRLGLRWRGYFMAAP